VAEVAVGVDLPGRPAAGGEAAARAEVGLLLEDDVDDAAEPVRVVLGRRVRHHLDLGHDVRRELGEEGAELLPAHRRDAAVDLHHHVRVAAQRHVVVAVDLDGGHVAQHVHRRAAAGRRHVLHGEAVAVGGERLGAAVGAHLDARQLRRHGGEREGAEVHARRRGGHGHVAPHERGEAEGAHAHGVPPGAQAVDAEPAVGAGDGAGDERRVASVGGPHGHRCVRQPLPGGADRAPGELPRRLRGRLQRGAGARRPTPRPGRPRRGARWERRGDLRAGGGGEEERQHRRAARGGARGGSCGGARGRAAAVAGHGRRG
jgi:hypothetical protein